MNKFSFWQKWLFVVGLLIIVFGITMAFFSGTPLFALFNSQVDPAFWGTEGIVDNVKRFQQWIYGVLGATVAGWGVFLAFIAHYPFKNREKWSWNCLVAGLLLWYLVDTAISLNFRVYFNAIFNSLLLILVMLPVIFTRKYLVQ
jgi:hypothetical protein